MTQPLTSSRALAPRAATTAVVPVSEWGERRQIAVDIAEAAAALPEAYRRQPGAVLLAMAWAESRDVDVLTAIQSVSFVSGRPVVDATMQRALAQRAGYRVVPQLADDRQSCTVVVSLDGKVIGTHTYTMADAQLAGLANKDVWKKHPGSMLVAAASRQAIRMFAPEVLLGVFDRDEIEDTAEVEWAVVESPTAPPAEPAQFAVVDADTGEIAPDDVFEAEVVEEPTASGDEMSSDELRKMLRAEGVGVPAIVRAAQDRWPDDEIGTISRVAEKGRAQVLALIAEVKATS